ncbi:hypothetical protein Tco_1054365 [Tanacetum coccineum]|uniref:Uncharacterized protein n=1 Tax=Tanacetum coccineum TaxID=301880 RepID=A0ABQ5GWJ2_9ASTR
MSSPTPRRYRWEIVYLTGPAELGDFEKRKVKPKVTYVTFSIRFGTIRDFMVSLDGLNHVELSIWTIIKCYVDANGHVEVYASKPFWVNNSPRFSWLNDPERFPQRGSGAKRKLSLDVQLKWQKGAMFVLSDGQQKVLYVRQSNHLGKANVDVYTERSTKEGVKHKNEFRDRTIDVEDQEVMRKKRRLDNQSIERDRLIGIGFVLDFVEFISFTFGDKEMILVIEAVSR